MASIAGADIREHWRVLRERRIVVLAGVLLVGSASLVHALLATPVYRATTTLQIERRGPDILTFEDVVQADPSGYWFDFYETQYRIIQSRGVLKLAAQDLDLANRPSLLKRRGSPWSRLTGWVRSLLAPPDADTSGEDGEAEERSDPSLRFAGFLAAGLNVEPIRQSRLVEIGFADRDPELARDAANAIAGAFVEFSLSARSTTTEAAKTFLNEEILRLQGEIDELERRLESGGSSYTTLSLGDDALAIGERTLAELNAHLADAHRRVALDAARLRSLEATEAAALPEVHGSPLIARLKEELAALERRHGQLSERFKPDWPELAELTREMERAETQLEREIERIAEKTLLAARADHEQGLAEVRDLEGQIATHTRRLQQTRTTLLEHASLRGEIDNRRELLRELVARRGQTESSRGLQASGTSNIRVVDRAIAPARPISPRPWRSLGLGLFVGMFLGVGAAFLLDHLDNTLKDDADVRRVAPSTPVLASVPTLEPLRVFSGGRDRASGTPPPDGGRQPDLASHAAPRSSFAEAFKNLRTSILLAAADRPPRHIQVTSPDPGAGKSTVSQNLAIVLAQGGKRVLLIDADLRKPRLDRALGVPNDVGLSSYLSGNAGSANLVLPTAIPDVSLIPSGPIPPNPSELLDSPRLTALLAESLRSYRFDHVIIDSPPLIQLADGLILATRAEATIVVVRAGATTRDSLAAGLERLRQAHATPIGVVLNGVSRRATYYAPYYYEAEAAGSAASPGRRRRA